ncbi:hypothetical protein [uncultured Rhodoferax sp.]|uniref:hypothetical protein n=1 Tax=uncultured Rhodoferax sp. TaxID=223188 RepID=UPI0025DB90CC|nr:hypothetical protein [uncultured Rhodoferax sp.]
MTRPNKPTPRFLPTLTEVVQPPVAPEPPAPPDIDTEMMVARVMQAIAPHIENQLRALVADLVQEQLRELSPRIQHDLEQMVRAAVLGAVDEVSNPRPD